MKMRLPILLLFLCCMATLSHGQQILVKAGNLTTGLSTTMGYTDYAPLSSFQLGAQSEASWDHGGGADVAPARPLEVQFTKHVDAFSNQLNYRIANGTSIPKMEIIWLVTNSKGAPAVAHKVEIEDVFITEIMNSSAEDCASCFMIAESYKAVYKTMKRTVYRQDIKTGNYSIANVFTWDVSGGNSELD